MPLLVVSILDVGDGQAWGDILDHPAPVYCRHANGPVLHPVPPEGDSFATSATYDGDQEAHQFGPFCVRFFKKDISQPPLSAGMQGSASALPDPDRPNETILSPDWTVRTLPRATASRRAK